MDFDLGALSQRKRYKLLSALVVPRPIGWITTLGESGAVNLAPYSFFNLLGTSPPVVAFGPDDAGPIKDTPRNVRRTGRFVVNVVSELQAEAMHRTSAPVAADVSEAEAARVALAPMPGGVPRVAEAPAALACREHTTLLIERTRVVLGVVEHLWVRDALFDADRYRIHQHALHAVGRLGGGLYTRVDPFSLGSRPAPEELTGEAFQTDRPDDR